jgi:hypothetical protein
MEGTKKRIAREPSNSIFAICWIFLVQYRSNIGKRHDETKVIPGLALQTRRLEST